MRVRVVRDVKTGRVLETEKKMSPDRDRGQAVYDMFGQHLNRKKPVDKKPGSRSARRRRNADV